jgi:hypothetical protein
MQVKGGGSILSWAYLFGEEECVADVSLKDHNRDLDEHEICKDADPR